MQFEFSYYLLPLLVAALISLLVAVYAWMHRETSSARSLVLISLAIMFWAITYALEIAATDLAAMLFWGKIQYFSITTIPLLWLTFTYNHAHPGKELPLSRVLLLAIIPALTIILVWTTERHGLIWASWRVAHNADFTVLEITSRGVGFWIYWVYSYILLLSGTYILLRSMWRMRGLYRAQLILIILSALAPWAGNALYILEVSPLDLTPFGFSITVLGALWAIFGFRLTDIVPIARDLVVEEMREGLLVLDMKGRIVDINAAAARFVGLPAAQVIGKPAIESLRSWSVLIERFRDVSEASEIVEVGAGEAVRKIGLRISPLSDDRQNLLGRVISFWEMDSVSGARLAPHLQEPLTQPLPAPSAKPSPLPPRDGAPGLRAIRDFFLPPPLKEWAVSGQANMAWLHTVERAVTSIARFVMAFGSLTAWNIFSTLDIPNRLGYAAAIALFLFGVYFLALARKAPFRLRLGLFLLLGYVMALAELLNRGISVNIMMYFVALVVIAQLLLGLRGAFVLLALSVATMFVFDWAVSSYGFVPFEIVDRGEVISQPNASLMANYLVGYLFSVLTVITIVNQFVLTLNNAWQQEAQTSNLLQQERDLLEHRVRERTAELRKARDQALQSRDELRTYYQAIEQSGSSIVITDPQGKIEYANPFFEKVTGYTLQEALGQNPNIIKSENQPPEFYRDLWTKITSGEIWQGEFLNRRKDGSFYWEFATIAPVKDESGKIAHYVAIKEDITAQKELREALARQNEYLSTLQGITLDLLERTDLKELLDNILTRAQAMLQSPKGSVLLWENDALVYRAVTKQRVERYGTFASRTDMPLAWEAFETRRPVFLQDYTSHYGPRPIDRGVAPLRAVADFPILAGSKALGVITLGRDDERPYSPSELEFGQALAQVAALVLDNASLYDSALRELEERKRIQASLELSEQEQRALADILRIGMSEYSLDAILETALDGLLSIQWLGIEGKGGIFLKDPQSDSLLLTTERNLGSQICALCASVPLGKCHCGRAALTGQIQFSSHVDETHEITYDGIPDHEHYSIPVLSGESVLGVVVIYLPAGYAYNERDVRFLQAFASTLSNIIRRKRTEELLRESEIRFRQIVENASDIIYRIDELGRMTYVNPVGLRLFGYESEKEVLGRHFSEFAVPAWRSRLKAFYKRQALTEQENTYYEFVSQTKDGSEVWLGQNVQIIRAENKVVGFQAVARDMTELKKTQFALAEARDEALEASRFKGQLLSRVSHELRTPLGGVMGYAELLEQGAFGNLSDEQLDAAQNIVDSANYLNTMINELLDQAQIEARAVKIQLAPFEPAVMLRSVHTKMTVLALNKGLQFLSEIDPALPRQLMGDERRLQQVSINLCGNAIKFTERGEVRVSMRKLSDLEWALQVADTGAGIPEEAQEFIFDAFRQVDNSITRDNRGTGLGLSITKQLVELMNGRIELESKVGQGSVFTIILPLQTPAISE